MALVWCATAAVVYAARGDYYSSSPPDAATDATPRATLLDFGWKVNVTYSIPHPHGNPDVPIAANDSGGDLPEFDYNWSSVPDPPLDLPPLDDKRPYCPHAPCPYISPCPTWPRPTLGCDVNYSDAGWRTVNLPHDFVVEGTFNKYADGRHGYLPYGKVHILYM